MNTSFLTRSHKVITIESAQIGSLGTCTSMNYMKNGGKSDEEVVGGSVELVQTLHLSKEIAISVIGKALLSELIVSGFIIILTATNSNDLEEFHQKSVR